MSENRYEPSLCCFDLAVSLAAFLRDLEVAAANVFFFVVVAGVFLVFIMHCDSLDR